MEGNTAVGFRRATQCESQAHVYEDPVFQGTIFIYPPPMNPSASVYYMPPGDFQSKNDENHQPILSADEFILHLSPNNQLLVEDAKSVRQPQNPNLFFAREIILSVVATCFNFPLGFVAFFIASKCTQ